MAGRRCPHATHRAQRDEPGHRWHRRTAAPAVLLLASLYLLFGRLQVIWADGGYAGALVAWVKGLRPFGKLHLDIVRRSDDAKGFQLVKKRWIVERTFSWLYKSRRLSRDYEQRPDHSESHICVCMSRLMLKRLAKQ